MALIYLNQVYYIAKQENINLIQGLSLDFLKTAINASKATKIPKIMNIVFLNMVEH